MVGLMFVWVVADEFSELERTVKSQFFSRSGIFHDVTCEVISYQSMDISYIYLV